MPVSGGKFRAFLMVSAAALLLSGCSLFGSDDATNDLNKDAAQYQERPIDQIYDNAWKQINKGNWDLADLVQRDGRRFSGGPARADHLNLGSRDHRCESNHLAVKAAGDGELFRGA